MSNEPTIQDILNAVKSAEKHTDAQFETIEKNTNAQFEEVLEVMNAASTETEQRLTELKSEMGTMKSEMATKKDLNIFKLEIIDAMDDKLVDLKGDLVLLMRKEDKKVTALIGLLTQRKIISTEDAKQLLGMEPFPQPI